MPWNPFDQDKFSREIFFARTLLQFTLSKAVFLPVTFDRCIWWRKTSNMKGLFKETEMYIYLNVTNKHLLVTMTHILLCSEWAQQYANLKGLVA